MEGGAGILGIKISDSSLSVSQNCLNYKQTNIDRKKATSSKAITLCKNPSTTISYKAWDRLFPQLYAIIIKTGPGHFFALIFIQNLVFL